MDRTRVVKKAHDGRRSTTVDTRQLAFVLHTVNDTFLVHNLFYDHPLGGILGEEVLLGVCVGVGCALLRWRRLPSVDLGASCILTSVLGANTLEETMAMDSSVIRLWAGRRSAKAIFHSISALTVVDIGASVGRFTLPECETCGKPAIVGDPLEAAAFASRIGASLSGPTRVMRVKLLLVLPVIRELVDASGGKTDPETLPEELDGAIYDKVLCRTTGELPLEFWEMGSGEGAICVSLTGITGAG
jgi:hypothetical protein